MQIRFDLDETKRYRVLKGRFLPFKSAKVYEGGNIFHLGSDELGFRIAWFALADNESYCWRCAAIVAREEVENGVCPICGGTFDD